MQRVSKISSKNDGPTVLRVAVPVPLFRIFDYLPPAGLEAKNVPIGSRISVPFGRTRRVGIVIETDEHSELAGERLRRALALLDSEPLLGSELLASLDWASRYYHHPLGEVLETALPVGLRRAQELPDASERALTLIGKIDDISVRAGSTSALLIALLTEGPVPYSTLDAKLPRWRGAATNLKHRGLVATTRMAPSRAPRTRIDPPPLTTDQQTAVATIGADLGSYSPYLLEGITGSGKTEVYLALAERVLANGQQALVLVPEIGLTPQLFRRFHERTAGRVQILHSGLTDAERTRAWLAAARGEAGVILGTRSAVFAPIARAGLIVVDEEHDGSYKQQDGLRYSARDLALVRGKGLNVPVILGTATPSLESLANVEAGRYRHLHLSSRPGAARVPAVRTIDLRGKSLIDGLAPEMIAAVRECVGRGEQALLFRNRRGYAPVLMCHGCGWHAVCDRCEKPLTWHRGDARLRCHHCGAEQRVPVACPQCGQTNLAPRGIGTERLEQALTRLFPQTPVVRIDRETTRTRNAFEKILGALPEDGAAILVGTQMMAKGHDLPNLTMVGLIGVDDGLYSVDFRAGERLCQLIVQVSGRAGRARKPGTVWLQTHNPDHPMLRDLLRRGYAHVARDLLDERRAAGLPPYAYLALLRAEATTQTQTDEFLAAAASSGPVSEHVSLLGPMPAPMPRRAGLHRGQILLNAQERSHLHAFLGNWLARLRELPSARKVRWSLDVDPLDLY